MCSGTIRSAVVAGLLVCAATLAATGPASAAQAPSAVDPVGAYGDAPSLGGPATSNAPVTGMAATPDGGGYWLVASDGGVFAFGDAGFYGSAAGNPEGYDVVGLATTWDGHGYWLVDSSGVVTNFGDAPALGAIPSTGVVLNQPVVGMAATPDGGGYWLVASDGGVFAFGDARFSGSEGATALNVPIIGLAATPDGDGYWLAGGDGGVFAYGDAGFHGSAGASSPDHPVAGIAATHDGGGYWLTTSVAGPTLFPSQPQVIADCASPTVEPTTIVLACADYDSLLEEITWSSWTAHGARGTGVYTYNDCIPYCARGTFHSAPATVTVRAPVSTSAGVEFTLVTWTFSDPKAPSGSTTYTDTLATSR